MASFWPICGENIHLSKVFGDFFILTDYLLKGAIEFKTEIQNYKEFREILGKISKLFEKGLEKLISDGKSWNS